MKKTALCFHQGAELYGSDLVFIEALRSLESKYRVEVVLDSRGPLQDRLSSLGLISKAWPLGVLRRRELSWLRIAPFAARFASAIVKSLREIGKHRPHVVYINTLGVCAPALAAWIARVPVVTHCHEIVQRPTLIGKFLARFHGCIAARIVAVSDAVREWLKAAGVDPSKIVVVRNGFSFCDLESDRDRFDIRREFGIESQKIVAACIGRLSEMKGQETVVEALAALAQSLKDRVVVVFFGDVFPGNETFGDRIKARVAEAGLTDAVRFAGFREDARRFLPSCDFALVPSRFPDPFPTTVLEGMAAGRCVVASRSGGIPEMIVAQETGLLFAPGEHASLAEAMSLCISDPQLAEELGRVARVRFDELFSSQRFQYQFVEAVDGCS